MICMEMDGQTVCAANNTHTRDNRLKKISQWCTTVVGYGCTTRQANQHMAQVRKIWNDIGEKIWNPSVLKMLRNTLPPELERFYQALYCRTPGAFRDMQRFQRFVKKIPNYRKK